MHSLISNTLFNNFLCCITWIPVLKQEGEPCGEILFEPDSDCGECAEGLICEPYISPAPPQQCGKCVKQKVRDSIDAMNLSTKKKGKSNMYFDNGILNYWDMI